MQIINLMDRRKERGRERESKKNIGMESKGDDGERERDAHKETSQ